MVENFKIAVRRIFTIRLSYFHYKLNFIKKRQSDFAPKGLGMLSNLVKVLVDYSGNFDKVLIRSSFPLLSTLSSGDANSLRIHGIYKEHYIRKEHFERIYLFCPFFNHSWRNMHHDDMLRMECRYYII